MKLSFSVILILFFCISKGQDTLELSLIKEHFQSAEQYHHHHHHYRDDINTHRSFAAKVLRSPLYIYKAVFSEQLSASCQFEPSCSAFGFIAISHMNFFKAIFLTADRLTRCNGYAEENIPSCLINKKTHLIEDSPTRYIFH